MLNETLSEKDFCTIKLNSASTIEQIVEIHTQLLKALKNHSSVSIDLTELVRAEFSLVQLLCAASKTMSAGKKLSLSPVQPNFLHKIRNAGFKENPPICRQCVSCIWSNIEEINKSK